MISKRATIEMEETCFTFISEAASTLFASAASKFKDLKVHRLIKVAQSEAAGRLNLSLVYVPMIDSEQQSNPIKMAVKRCSPFEMEKVINDWFKKLAAREIVQLGQSQSEGNVTICLFYRT
jgi:hypothetical protein